MKPILILSALLMLGAAIAYGQGKSEFSKTIPVVFYSPGHFHWTINASFSQSPVKQDITIHNGDTLYTSNYFGHSDTWKNDFFERNNIHTTPFFTQDSIFIVRMGDESVTRVELPIHRMYGIKKNGKYRYGLTSENGELYSFKELIEKRYGSVKKFEERYMFIQKRLFIMMNESSCGIAYYPKDPESMRSFLKDDYLMHEYHNPSDTINVVNRFLSLANSFVPLKASQETLIRKELMQYIRRDMDAHAIPISSDLRLEPERFLLYGVNVQDPFSRYLPKEQFADLQQEFRIYNKHRAYCIDELKLYKRSTVVLDGVEWPEIGTYDERLKETADTVLAE